MSYELFEERIKSYEEWMEKNDTISKAKAIEKVMHCTRYVFPTIQQMDGQEYEEYVRLYDVLRELRGIEGVSDGTDDR